MLERLFAIIAMQKYGLYSRPFELNIVGIRAANRIANRFDDRICVFFKGKGDKWILHQFAATTDPGRYWLQNPCLPIGTAILKPGQYAGAYRIGLHRKRYIALVQQLPVTVIRDGNRDKVLNFDNTVTTTGLFGINIHHAAATGVSSNVDNYSAGCQVIASITDFNLLMQLAEKHHSLYGNSFTYTLLREEMIKEG